MSAGHDSRQPLDLAAAIAERFMKLSPPRNTYMYHRGMIGLLDLWEGTRDSRYLDFYLSQHDRGAPRFDWRLYTLTDDTRWTVGVEELAENFLSDPRRDREGALLDPRGRYTVDCFSYQFTMPIIYGHILKDERFFNEAARLFEIYRGYLEDPQTGVWYSRWGHSLHPGRPNPGLWARGNGWLADAWGRTMHLWDPTHGGYEDVLQSWLHFCRSLAAFQTPSGLFHQLLNRDDCFEEATGSGLLCSGFAHGVRQNTLPPEFGATAYRTFCGLRGLVDGDGNIHNVSTYAGGYNFERQYYSCARYNEPHGDGTVMSACVALELLTQDREIPATDEPLRPACVITDAIPRLLSDEPPEKRSADDIARPLLERVLALDALPAHDLYGSTILGLLHWGECTENSAVAGAAEERLGQWGDDLVAAARWNLTAEFALHGGTDASLPGLKHSVDDELARLPRDRCGVFLDGAGGYTIDRLYVWLPLLAKMGALTGEDRYLDEACTQLFGHGKWLEDPRTSLWYSAFGHGAHPRRVSPGLWGLGNGYCLAGIVGLLGHLPRRHDRYIDAICLLRRYVSALHEYLPVGGAWTQQLDDYRSFSCVGATALITYGCARAILEGWVGRGYYPAVTGGIHGLGRQADRDGTLKLSSLPTGGLDTLEAMEAHQVQNDPGMLGFVLSACAWGARCMRSGMDPHEQDKRLGAR